MFLIDESGWNVRGEVYGSYAAVGFVAKAALAIAMLDDEGENALEGGVMLRVYYHIIPQVAKYTRTHTRARTCNC